MLKILLLDDDENMKMLLEYYLKRCKIAANIDQFFNLSDAEQTNNDYDIWIVDHRLNNATGLDFILRRKAKPFIYESFYLTEALKENVLKNGGVPLDKNDLLENPESLGKALKELKVAA